MANPTVAGELLLYPAFEHIGVISKFTGDDNGNNAAYVEWRPVGDIRWRPGVDLVIDRRAQLVEYGAGSRTNPYRNQARGVIFGNNGVLREKTSYEVRVTYVDPDGVSGSPVTAITTTRDSNPPSVGRVFYVAIDGNNANNGSESAPWRTPQYAAGRVQPGDIVRLKPGTYTGMLSLTISGLANNYITWESTDPANLATISGGNPHDVYFACSYNRVRNINLTDVVMGSNRGANVLVGGREDDPSGPLGYYNIVENCPMINSNGDWLGGGVLIGRAYGTLVQGCQMTGRGTGDDRGGVMFWNDKGGTVVRRNYIRCNGMWKDGMLSAPGNSREVDGPGPNSFIYDNDIAGSYDDCIESEGGNMNVVVGPNRCDASMGLMGVACASACIGPLYIVRNSISNHSDAAVKMGSSSYGTILIYHNTIWTSRAGYGPSSFGSDPIQENVIALNNIICGNPYRVIGHYDTRADAGRNKYDYNCYQSTSGFVAVWYNKFYTSLAAFRTGTGQEANGVNADPQLNSPTTGDFTLRPTSPCINAGVVIPGINDADSPWPYQGSEPDIGAFEVAGPVPPPVAEFTATPSEGTVPLTVQFTNQSTGSISSYAWSFGDGTTSSGKDPSHTYGVMGTYTVTLTVTGPGGQSTATLLITATSLPPVASFIAVPTSGIAPLTVQFTDQSTGNISSWLWDFGDGTTSTLQNPSHIYPAGVYIVTLTVTGPGGSNSQSATIRVTQMYSLTLVATEGGTTVPAPGIRQYGAGTEVDIGAIPSAGYRFAHWLEGGAVLSEQQAITLVMDSDRSLTAVFAFIPVPPNQYSLTISMVGRGRTEPPLGSYIFNEGELAEVRAIADSGWKFDHWEGDITGTANPVTIEMERNLSIVAVFEEVEVPPPQLGGLIIPVAGLLITVISIVAQKKGGRV